MVDSRTVRVLGARERFGQARASGSAAFIVSAFGAGAVIGAVGPGGQFLLYAPLLAATGIAAWTLLVMPVDEVRRVRRRPTASALGRAAGMAFRGLSPATIGRVLALPRFGLFFVASIVIWTSHAALQAFISLRVTALGGDPTAVAAAWSVGALIEVPLMLSFPRLARRIGPERLIVIGAFAFATRSFISGVAQTPWEIVLAGAFAGVGFAFVYVGTVTWIAGAVSRSTQATAQGFITGTATSIGAIVGAVGGGALGGAFGLPTLFLVTAGGYALGGVLVWFAIAADGSVPLGASAGAAAPDTVRDS
jgi:PPP family 3-phenylpropionic acid transporter